MTAYTCPQCQSARAPWVPEEDEPVPLCVPCLRVNLDKIWAAHEAMVIGWAAQDAHVPPTTRARL